MHSFLDLDVQGGVETVGQALKTRDSGMGDAGEHGLFNGEFGLQRDIQLEIFADGNVAPHKPMQVTQDGVLIDQSGGIVVVSDSDRCRSRGYPHFS